MADAHDTIRTLDRRSLQQGENKNVGKLFWTINLKKKVGEYSTPSWRPISRHQATHIPRHPRSSLWYMIMNACASLFFHFSTSARLAGSTCVTLFVVLGLETHSAESHRILQKGWHSLVCSPMHSTQNLKLCSPRAACGEKFFSKSFFHFHKVQLCSSFFLQIFYNSLFVCRLVTKETRSSKLPSCWLSDVAQKIF